MRIVLIFRTNFRLIRVIYPFPKGAVRSSDTCLKNVTTMTSGVNYDLQIVFHFIQNTVSRRLIIIE